MVPSVRVSAPGPEFDMLSTSSTAQEQEAANSIPNPFQETRPNPVRQLQHLPREQQRPVPMGQAYYNEGSYGDQQQRSFSAIANKAGAPPPQVSRMYAPGSQQPIDFQLKETSPTLGGGRVIGGRVYPGEKAGAYDLVEKMQYLFVRVVKARDLPNMDITGSLDPFVEVHLGNYKMKIPSRIDLCFVLSFLFILFCLCVVLCLVLQVTYGNTIPKTLFSSQKFSCSNRHIESSDTCIEH